MLPSRAAGTLPLLLLLTAIGAAGVGGARAGATAPPQGGARLFSTAQVSGTPVRGDRPWARRSRFVAIDPEAWPLTQPEESRSSPASIQLDLFDDASVTAERERIDRTTRGFVWVGRVRGEPLGSVTLASVEGVLAGSIITPRAVYSIRSAGPGAYEVVEVDTSRLPPDGEPLTPTRVPRHDSKPAAAAAAAPASSTTRAPAASLQGSDPLAESGSGAPIIDVLALYTPAAGAAAGGASAMAALLDLGVSETNTSYANSGISQRVRLVRAEEIDYAEHDELSTDLYNLSSFDGAAPLATEVGHQAALLRDIHGADAVVLVTAPPLPSSCGIAWMMTELDGIDAPFAFSVVDHGCVSPNGSLGHELGHNMGARHDWYVDDGVTPFTYAHGFVNTTGRWRTVMAYGNLCAALSISCPRLLYWSNPDVTYDGAPMGIPGGTKSDCPQGDVSNVSCDADDHRALNETSQIVASYRKGWLRAASDFTRDLRSDILWRHASAGDVWIWPMEGAARGPDTYVRTVADTAWQIRGVGDQTGDGRADILWRNAATGEIYLWSMGDGSPAEESSVGVVSTAFDIAGTGDFDGDGKSDILWKNASTGEVWIWLMNGASRTGEAYVDTVAAGYAVEGTGDLDGDLIADIVWRGASGDIWAWLMRGTARRSQAMVGIAPDTGYRIAAVADFTADGKADLLWHHATRGEVWIWAMDGASRAAEALVGTVPDTAYGIAMAGDYDGDHLTDILWRHATRGEVWVWQMDGLVKHAEALVGIVPDTGYRIVR